jgi:peptide-methionine (S)-S-oxide reductase
VKVFPGSGKVVEGNVGFMGPATAKKDPSYKEVCTGTTGHVEVYDLKFEGGETAYENLVKHFFMFHDPTTLNRQGNDRGTQYASAIFVYDDKQKEIATRVKKELQELINKSKIPGYQNKEVVTHITEATTFYPAHEEHQEYLEKNPGGYCNHGYRFSHWPKNGN